LLDRRPYGTSRLRSVPAVAKATIGRHRIDLVEAGGSDLVGPQRKLPKAGRIDEDGTVGQGEQLSLGRRVTPAVVAVLYGAFALNISPYKAVRERRLADARGADKRGGLPRREMTAEHLEATCTCGARRHDGKIWCERIHFRDGRG